MVRIDTRSGHVKRVDRWVVPQRMEVKVTSGHVLLDFTQAEITQPTLKLDVDVRSGHVRLLTKPGIVVDTDDVAIRSGHVRVKTPWGPDVPVQLHIEVTGKVGSGHLVARPRYRNALAVADQAAQAVRDHRALMRLLTAYSTGAPGCRRGRPRPAGPVLGRGAAVGGSRRGARRGGRVAAGLQLPGLLGAAAGVRAGARAEDRQEPGAPGPGHRVGAAPGGRGGAAARPGRGAGRHRPG